MSTYTKSKHAQYWNNREQSLAKSAAYYRENRQRLIEAQEIRNYGETRASIISRYPPGCSCCGTLNPGGKRGWNIDHDHHTMKIRGVLCTTCNTGIGKLGDSIAGLERALAYLRRTA